MQRLFLGRGLDGDCEGLRVLGFDLIALRNQLGLLAFDCHPLIALKL